MVILKRLISIYIQSSLHVALAVVALVQITQIFLEIEATAALKTFAFFGTVASYNFVKYDALVRTGSKPFGGTIKAIAAISLLSILAGAAAFIFLELETQILALLVLIAIILYTLPLFPTLRNARNWAGIKIYIVTLCWVAVTVLLPATEAAAIVDVRFWIVLAQRALFVFVLLLVFEIVDLKKDDPRLKTVPQIIGVRLTKAVGLLLLIIFTVLAAYSESLFVATSAIAFITAVTLLFASRGRHPYYTLLWAESIPILWWLTTTYH